MAVVRPVRVRGRIVPVVMVEIVQVAERAEIGRQRGVESRHHFTFLSVSRGSVHCETRTT